MKSLMALYNMLDECSHKDDISECHYTYKLLDQNINN